MKRLWIGIVIMLLLSVGSYTVSTAMENVHRPVAQSLQQAGTAALAGDWSAALSSFRQADERWEKYHRFTAAFADHSPMDEMDALFRELTVYAGQKDTTHFSALCKHLSFLAAAMAESHCLTWWNLL